MPSSSMAAAMIASGAAKRVVENERRYPRSETGWFSDLFSTSTDRITTSDTRKQRWTRILIGLFLALLYTGVLIFFDQRRYKNTAECRDNFVWSERQTMAIVESVSADRIPIHRIRTVGGESLDAVLFCYTKSPYCTPLKKGDQIPHYWIKAEKFHGYAIIATSQHDTDPDFECPGTKSMSQMAFEVGGGIFLVGGAILLICFGCLGYQGNDGSVQEPLFWCTCCRERELHVIVPPPSVEIV